MHHLLITILLTFLIHISTLNAAEYNLRPGLWQITTTSNLLQLLPYVPSEQMQNIKDFAKGYGFDMPQIDNGAAISQACITLEMSKQKTLPNFYQNQAGCFTKNATRSGNNYLVEFTCESDELTGSGTAEGKLTSPESFSGQTKFTGIVQGNSVDEKADMSGIWMNASCGTVKPM